MCNSVLSGVMCEFKYALSNSLSLSLYLSFSLSEDLSPRTMPQDYLTWWLLAVPSPPGCAAAPVSTVLPYYYSTMLVIYEHLNILAMFCYNPHPAQPEEDWPPLIAWFLSSQYSQKRTGHPSEPGSSLGFFLGSGLSREFFVATVLLHLHCLLFGVLGWVSVQHFEISADVRRAI